MKNKISSDDQGEQRRTDLDVPLLPPDIFNTVVTMFLNDIAFEQWRQLLAGRVDLDTFILLSDMCWEIVDTISTSVLKAVEPQAANGDASSSSTSWSGTQGKRQHHIYRVTEEAIRGCLGDSLHRCFGEALGLEQERTHESDELVKLFGGEVMKKVNRKLAPMEAPTSPQQTKTSEASAARQAEDMVRLVADVLRKCKKPQTWLHNDESGGCCPDEVTPVEELRAEGAEPVLRSDQAGGPSQDRSTKPIEELLPDKTFLAVFLRRLLVHIATETRTAISVRFYGMLARLTERTKEELTSSLLQTPSNLHVCIYEELCQEFGCAEKLLSAVASNPAAFEEAVARALKAKLAKSQNNKNFVKRVTRFFHKASKFTQGFEKNTSDRNQEPQKKKRFRILSSVENHLMQTYSAYSCAFQQSVIIPAFMYYMS